jgi:hypothetical protein
MLENFVLKIYTESSSAQVSASIFVFLFGDAESSSA